MIGNKVRWQLQRVLPGLTTKQISEKGMTGLQGLMTLVQKHLVAEAYAYAVRAILYGSTALSAAYFILACFVVWKSIKENRENGGEKKG